MSNEEWHRDQGFDERAMRSLEEKDRDIELENEILRRTLRSVLFALDSLLREKPMLAAKKCGSSTLGNLRAEVKGIIEDEI